MGGRKGKEKQEKELAKKANKKPAFKPGGGSELRGDMSARGSSKYQPLVTKWDTTKAFSGSSARRAPIGRTARPCPPGRPPNSREDGRKMFCRSCTRSPLPGTSRDVSSRSPMTCGKVLKRRSS